MNAKKVLAMTLATAMVVGSSMTVLADVGDDTGSASGTGGVEGYVATDVVNVVAPTSASFTFTIDPQGLVKATEASKYGSGLSVEDETGLLFANTTDGEVGTGENDVTTGYSSKSDKFTFTNKSVKAVSISVTGTLSGLGTDPTAIAVSESDTFDGTTPSIYMAFVDANSESTAFDSTGAAEIAGSASKAPSDTYEVVYADSKYSYNYLDDGTGYDTYEFYLTGACDTNADWTDYTSITPSLSVTWKIDTVDESAPSIETTEYTMAADTDVEISVNLGSGDLAATGISSITYVTTSGKTSTLGTEYYTLADGTLTIGSSFVNLIYTTDRTLTIKFNDEAATVIKVTLNAATE